MKINYRFYTPLSILARAFGMWFFVLAVAVVVVSTEWTFSLIGSFGLVTAAGGCFYLADRFR